MKINILGLITLLLIIWCVISVVWSVDVSMTVRRLAGLVASTFAVFALTRIYSITVIPYFALFISTITLLVSIYCETMLIGVQFFQPDYRLSGIMHPNVQAINCGVMLISAITIAGGNQEQYRISMIMLAAIALFSLILTKSRTSFVCIIIAITLAWGILYPHSSFKKIFIIGILWFAYIFGIAYMFTNGEILSLFDAFINLGRKTEGNENFNGRMDIWLACIDYILDRPIIGYGFSSFWNTLSIQEISSRVGFGVGTSHSTILELMLNIGMIGAFIYVITVLIGMRWSAILFKKTKNIGYSFHFTLSLFFAQWFIGIST